MRCDAKKNLIYDAKLQSNYHIVMEMINYELVCVVLLRVCRLSFHAVHNAHTIYILFCLNRQFDVIDGNRSSKFSTAIFFLILICRIVVSFHSMTIDYATR